MTHDKPYIIPHTADTPAVLFWAGRMHQIDPKTALFWMHRLSEYLWSHNVVVLPEPAREVTDE
jgi:hypothetical protein